MVAENADAAETAAATVVSAVAAGGWTRSRVPVPDPNETKLPPSLRWTAGIMHLASMLSIAAAASVSVGTTSAIARTPQVAYQRCRHGHLSVAGARGTSLDVTNLRVSWISCKRIAAAVRAGTFEATPGVFAVLDSRVYVRRAGGSAAARGKAALLPLQPRASEVRVPRPRVLLRQVGSQSGSDEKRIAITGVGFARAGGWVTPGVFAVRPLAPDHARVDNATGRPAPAVQQARLSRLHSLSKASDARFHTAVQRPAIGLVPEWAASAGVFTTEQRSQTVVLSV